MQVIFSLFLLWIIVVIAMFYHIVLVGLSIILPVVLLYMIWRSKQNIFKPKSTTYREIEKLKRKRLKINNNKHQHINDQISYISTKWGYTKEQEKIIEKFIESRAYSEMYNKLTASLFPQMIALIEYCNEREKKGCKREVSKRLRELTTLMKEELKKKKILKSESYETTLEVYDQIIKGG